MNSTVWNSQEEVVWSFVLAPVTVLIHGYAIYLCYAIYDYQNEKPSEEKSATDVLIKDLKNSEFCFLISNGLVLFISLFTPPMTTSFIYLIAYFCLFFANFFLISWLVLLYVQYMYVFYPDESENIDDSVLRRKSLLWKIILTILTFTLNYLVPSEEIPLAIQILLKKENQHDRYLAINSEVWLYSADNFCFNKA